MKIKVSKHKDYLTFSGENVRGEIYYDGSGELITKSRKYIRHPYLEESGKHEDRVEDIKNLYLFYKKVYNQLKNLTYKDKLVKPEDHEE